MRAHALVSVVFLLSRAALDAAGLQFYFALDWMWLSDPVDLRTRLAETLLYYHAFPPGMNALTGVLLKIGGGAAPLLAHALFLVLGLAFVNLLFAVGRALGLRRRTAGLLSVAFVLTPPAIYFEHLYLYDWPVAVLLAFATWLVFHAVRRPTASRWGAVFAVCAAIGLTRSTFHLVWFLGVVAFAMWSSGGRLRRDLTIAAAAPALVLLALYTKNLVLFGDFAASTFGPSSYTLTTVAQLPEHVRGEWIANGRLSPFAGISVYAAPREYCRFFATARRDGWPDQLTRLEHRAVSAPNFNHWWLLDVHRARREDAIAVLASRPGDYLSQLPHRLADMFGPITTWHPRDETASGPHARHREVLSGYEAWFNRALHGAGAPWTVYALLILPCVAAVADARRRWRTHDPAARAQAALVYWCAGQILYVVLVSTAATALESPRYRLQIDWTIWLLAAVGIAALRERATAARAS